MNCTIYFYFEIICSNPNHADPKFESKTQVATKFHPKLLHVIQLWMIQLLHSKSGLYKSLNFRTHTHIVQFYLIQKNGLWLILKGCMPLHTEVIADGGTIDFKVKENGC